MYCWVMDALRRLRIAKLTATGGITNSLLTSSANSMGKWRTLALLNLIRRIFSLCYNEYLGIDSELSWKHRSDITCHKIRRSVRIIAKMRHYIPRYLLLNLYHAFITTYLNYVICAWGNCPQTYLNKCLVLQKRALRLIYFAKTQRPCNSFF